MVQIFRAAGRQQSNEGKCDKWEECVGIEEVRPTEKVEQHRARRRQLSVRPGPDVLELMLLNAPKCGIEALGAGLPGPVLGQRTQRRSRRGSSRLAPFLT
jgi:hypothetical protein